MLRNLALFQKFLELPIPRHHGFVAAKSSCSLSRPFHPVCRICDGLPHAAGKDAMVGHVDAVSHQYRSQVSISSAETFKIVLVPRFELIMDGVLKIGVSVLGHEF